MALPQPRAHRGSIPPGLFNGSHSASGRLSPDHPCWDEQVATPHAHSSDPRVKIEYGEMMDLPVLTAVISVSGTLLGAIVGGCLTMYSNFFLNRRRE